MYCSTEASLAGPEPLFAPISPVTELLSGLPELVGRTSRLIQSAALSLGLDMNGAVLAGQTATLSSAGRTIAILPTEQSEDGILSLVLSVQTSLPVNAGGEIGDAVALLQHAPGALHAFAASLGATPDGYWVLFRSVRVISDDAPALAAQLVETVRLADFLLPAAQQNGH